MLLAMKTLWTVEKIPELKIQEWTLVEVHDSFYIDHLLHLGTSFYYTGRGTGINLETYFELRKDTLQ